MAEKEGPVLYYSQQNSRIFQEKGLQGLSINLDVHVSAVYSVVIYYMVCINVCMLGSSPVVYSMLI